jgi:hypothetical protein
MTTADSTAFALSYVFWSHCSYITMIRAQICNRSEANEWRISQLQKYNRDGGPVDVRLWRLLTCFLFFNAPLLLTLSVPAQCLK